MQTRDIMEQLITALVISPSNEILRKVKAILLEAHGSNLSSFISESFQSLYNLEQWAWQVLSRDCRQWNEDEQDYYELFCALASFNLELALNKTQTSTKASLLLPQTFEIVDGVFNQIERRANENDRFLTVISLWFDVLSYFTYEHIQFQSLPLNMHINERIEHDFLLTDEFQFYLKQLQQSSSTLTIKQLFYLKTCVLSFNVHLHIKSELEIETAAEKFMEHLDNDHRNILIMHSYSVATWSKELLTCLTHLLSLIATCCWWIDEKSEPIHMFNSSESILLHEYVEALIRILNYKPFHEQITGQWCNDQTILIDAILALLIYLVEIENIVCFLRSETRLADTLLTMNVITNDRIYWLTYRLLADILTDEQVKKMKIARQMSGTFFDFLEQAWLSPSQIHKTIPIEKLLLGFLTLAKNDIIQTIIADSPKFPLLIEMSDCYPIIFNILWTLSFNVRMQERLRSDAIFFEKFSEAEKMCRDEEMHKVLLGIAWNLDFERVPKKDQIVESFDMIISYAHNDKHISQQLYDELVRAGYRVWIDFNHQTDDNIMDAMAHAIERSRTIIICMSEHYRRSSYCRAEAQYAFKCQLKIVPILVQQYYKSDGWLAFLIGELAYIDFSKNEFFSQAIQKLLDQLKTPTLAVIDSLVLHMAPQNMTNIVLSSFPAPLPIHMHDWTEEHVQQWLKQNNFIHLARLLNNCNGPSLIHLNTILSSDRSEQRLNLLQEESIKQTGQSVSLIEISRLQTLIQDRLKILNNKKWYSSICCRTM